MGDGVRKLIYLPSAAVWASMRTEAKKQGRSISNYLVNLHWVTEGAGQEKINLEGVDSPEKQTANSPNPVEKAKKDIKKAESKKKATGWVNPLANSILAPKEKK